jgi:putative chitinase
MSRGKNEKIVNCPVITEEQLKKVFPNADKKKLADCLVAINLHFPKFNIDTPARIAAWLGQVAVESGELKYMKELPSKYNKKDVKDKNEPVGSLYEGRKNLGNTQAGDGAKYIGRGYLQLTGRANYAEYGKKLGLDLVNKPELAEGADAAVQIACQYFKDRGLLELADKWDLDTITLKVNGRAKLHLEQRCEYSEKALKVLTA